jgi:4Fe-4S ferredoxin
MLDLKDGQSKSLPEMCTGWTCAAACPKCAQVIGSVGSVARGLIDKDFIEKKKGECVFCSICARVCPTGALEVRTHVALRRRDVSYQHAGLEIHEL